MEESPREVEIAISLSFRMNQQVPEFLFVKRAPKDREDFLAGRWAPLTETVNPHQNESMMAAAVRGIREEVANQEPTQPLRIREASVPAEYEYKGVKYKHQFFLAEVSEATLTEENAELKWMTLAELDEAINRSPELFLPDIRIAYNAMVDSVNNYLG